MPGSAIIAPMTFTDSTLPVIDITYSPPLPGAIHDWNVGQLPTGPISTWASGTSGAAFIADLGAPQVVDTTPGKALRFNGTTDRMRSAFTVTGPHTLVAVYRLTAIEASQMILYGYNSYDGGAILTDSASTFVAGRSGATTFGLSPAVAPDTNWHVAILSLDGANSAFQLDDAARVGSLPLGNMDGLALGRGGSPDFLGPIELKRVAVLAGGTTPALRASILTTLKDQYGI